MTRAVVTEQQIAEVVVAYLEAMGADVYQEVECGGGVADIVARVGAELWIVEVKTSLSLALLVQARDRRRAAHRVYLAAPRSRNLRDVADLCGELGVGVLEVHPPYEHYPGCYEPPRVEERVSSRRWNRRPVALAGKLRPEHKTHAKAGAVGAAGRWTPFRDTCEQLAHLARREPGVTLKAAIEQIKHHYRTNASARGSLAHWIERGKVPGVELRKSPAGIAQLFPAGTQKGSTTT